MQAVVPVIFGLHRAQSSGSDSSAAADELRAGADRDAHQTLDQGILPHRPAVHPLLFQLVFHQALFHLLQCAAAGVHLGMQGVAIHQVVHEHAGVGAAATVGGR